MMNSVMRGELIIIGDEILDGRVINTNASFLARRLAAMGLRPERVTTLGDRTEDLIEELRQAVERSDFVLVTGGLGPTEDDLTAAVAAEALDRPLILFDEILAEIRDRCRAQGRRPGPLEKLAWLPTGAERLTPDQTCCGFRLDLSGCLVFFLPGVPAEARELFDRAVAHQLAARFPDRPGFAQRTLKLVGLFESQVEAKIADLFDRHPKVAFGSYPNHPEVHISLTAQGPDEDALEERLDAAEADIRARVGQYVFGRDGEVLEGVVGELLRERGLSLAVAESCTGGLLARRITSTAGASDYFIEGVVAYANRAKEELLGVDRELLIRHGAVSPQVALAMAEGLKSRARVDVAASVTGIAGPSGGSPDKPVGTVYFGLAVGRKSQIEHRRFPGDRRQVQALSAAHALDMIRRALL